MRSQVSHISVGFEGGAVIDDLLIGEVHVKEGVFAHDMGGDLRLTEQTCQAFTQLADGDESRRNLFIKWD